MEKHNQPVAALSQNDLNALASILYFYEQWLLHSMTPSTKRSKLTAEVQLLLVKVSFLGTARITTLTFDEVEHITAAIRTFSAHVKKKISPSKNREEVLASCEGLRSYYCCDLCARQDIMAPFPLSYCQVGIAT